MKSQGLTDDQVAAKIAAGKVNKLPKKTTGNTIPQIILRSTFTVFNLVNLVLALMIIAVGSYKNLLFLLIAIANTLISIINEIRAKHTIDKLKLQTEQKPSVIRNGEIRQIPASQIVEGDLLVLSLGDQILVDATVQNGELEVNESFITGEQDNVRKAPGDRLISGSFVVAGTCQATVASVGTANYLTKLEASARTISRQKSHLFTLMNNIVKYISFALIPIGILLLWRQLTTQDITPEITALAEQATPPDQASIIAFLTSPRVVVAVTSTVAALINMIPEGLILLTSSVLALATIRLSKKQVLVQDLYSIETLARVDTICLDKTGTLTTGHLRVKKFLPAPHQTEKSLQEALAAILRATTADNATSAALRQKLARSAKIQPTGPITEVVPFSSERKYSGVQLKNREILMGALEFLTDDPTTLATAQKVLSGVPNLPHYRVITVLERVHTRQAAKSTSVSPQSPYRETLLGFALLEDEIRHDASQIIRYFEQNDVAIRIISGDNLATVTDIATKVGVPETAAVDLSTVGSHPSYDRLVRDYQIFTRVTPSQKKSLIAALKKQGRTVAMTGDGVNDILAMKEADCSIAIGAGADAARRTAQLVLLSSDFAAVPSIIAEGRQTINNLERSGTLFLTKTVYASILAIVFTLLPLEYPYSPIEMSLLNFLCIGLPGLVLALETNTARIKDQFLHNIKKYSVPTGINVAVAMIILAILDQLLHISRPDLLTISAVITFLLNLILIFRITRPLNPFRATLIGLTVAIFAIALLVPPLRMLFIS